MDVAFYREHHNLNDGDCLVFVRRDVTRDDLYGTSRWTTKDKGAPPPELTHTICLCMCPFVAISVGTTRSRTSTLAYSDYSKFVRLKWGAVNLPPVAEDFAVFRIKFARGNLAISSVCRGSLKVEKIVVPSFLIKTIKF